MKKISWKDIASRITGISIPIFGISWEPKPNERKIAEEILTYIESKGLFYSPFHWEHPKDCYTSATEIRNELTVLMQKLNRTMKMFEYAEHIRDAVQKFQRDLRESGMEEKRSKGEMDNKEVSAFDRELVLLRTASGEQIVYIAATYGLDVRGELNNWLQYPPGKKN